MLSRNKWETFKNKQKCLFLWENGYRFSIKNTRKGTKTKKQKTKKTKKTKKKQNNKKQKYNK